MRTKKKKRSPRVLRNTFKLSTGRACRIYKGNGYDCMQAFKACGADQSLFMVNILALLVKIGTRNATVEMLYDLTLEDYMNIQGVFSEQFSSPPLISNT